MPFPFRYRKQAKGSRLPRWLPFIRDKTGIASLDFLIILPFLLFFLLIGIDFMRWQMTVSSIHNVAQTTVVQMEKRGGMNEQLLEDVTYWMEMTDLDPEQWSISATSVDDESRPWAVTFQTRVPFRAFSLFGLDVSVPLEVTRVGIDHKRAKKAKMVLEKEVWP